MAESPEKKKRKRDVKEVDTGVDEARITYHTPFKTFERLFNEASLDDTKRVVRAKLGLGPGVGMELAQIRGGSRIVLEDEDDFRAFCVALRANPQVDVQVTLANAPHSATTHVQDAEMTAPAPKKRKTKQSIDPPPTNTTPAAAYATPANSTTHPSISFSTSSIASFPPSSASPSDSTSPATVTSPLLAFPSLPAPFTTHTSITAPAVRTLPPATGILGPNPTLKGSGRDKKDKAVDKADRSIVKDADDEGGEEEEKKEKKEKPKRVRKKSEAASAPAAPMSPAAREKAAAILERHRQAVAERAKAPPRKRTKKVDTETEVKAATKPSKVEETPTGGGEDVELDEEPDKPKKEKRKKKKKKQVVEEEAEREGTDENEDVPEPAREENPPKTAREASPSKEKRGRKKKDKERSSPARPSVPLGTLAVAEDDGDDFVDLNMENGTGKLPSPDEKAERKSKLPTPASNANPTSSAVRPANSSTILSAKKGDQSIIVPPAALITTPAQTKPLSTAIKQPASSVTSAKSPPPEPKATSPTPTISKPLCPICLEPFHLRYKCPLLQVRGPALDRRLAELKQTGHTALVGELLAWVEAEKKRDQLRALGKPGNAGTMGKHGQGGRAVVLGEYSDGGGATGGSKKRLMSFESEERDEPEDDEEKEVESDVLGDLDATEEEEDDNGDDNDRTNSVPASLGKPPTTKRSLVSVQKPGEGSETTSSDSEDEDEEMEPIAHNGDDGEDEDEEMNDASRASTPQAPFSKPGDKQKTSSPSSSSSTTSDPPSAPDKRKTNNSQNKSGKPSTARSPRSFRGINDEPDDGATDALHQRMQRDTAQVLVPNSDDSGEDDMVEGEEPHTPNGRLPIDRLFQHRGSPVAKGRTPGTPGRIQIMKDRHGNTAPVQRSYRDGGTNEDEYNPPSAHPFPIHKLQSASQPPALPTRKFSMPRLSDLSASMRSMLKGVPPASSPIPHGSPMPIIVPPSGRVLNGASGKDSQEDSSSSSSTDSDSNSGRGAPRLPKGQRAGATLAKPQKKSLLERM